jgi:hypothetical protein
LVTEIDRRIAQNSAALWPSSLENDWIACFGVLADTVEFGSVLGKARSSSLAISCLHGSDEVVYHGTSHMQTMLVHRAQLYEFCIPVLHAIMKMVAFSG